MSNTFWDDGKSSYISSIQAVLSKICKGTAIQNDYAEMWTVLDWSNPGRLGTKEEWTTAVTLPLKVGQSQKATDEELAIARVRFNYFVLFVCVKTCFSRRSRRDLLTVYFRTSSFEGLYLIKFSSVVLTRN